MALPLELPRAGKLSSHRGVETLDVDTSQTHGNQQATAASFADWY